MMLLWLVAVVVIAWLAWALIQRGGFGASRTLRASKAEAVLRERFARGEIDEPTYRRMLDELRR